MYLSEDNIIVMSEIKQENLEYHKLIQDLDLQNENIYENVSLNGGKKRVRLHQLSWEEKLQRKKLRNRIAAQTSRDRKKAKMDFLEESIKQLKHQNNTLLMQVEELKHKNEALMDANEELQKELTVRNYTCSNYRKCAEDKNVSDTPTEDQMQFSPKNALSSKRPAESFDFPQQKGHWAILPERLAKLTSLKLLKIFLLYLLSQKSWKTTKRHSLMTLKDWQHICWRKLNKKDTEKAISQYLERFQELTKRNALQIMKWWGPHQKSWNPIEILI